VGIKIIWRKDVIKYREDTMEEGKKFLKEGEKMGL